MMMMMKAVFLVNFKSIVPIRHHKEDGASTKTHVDVHFLFVWVAPWKQEQLVW